MTKSFNLRRRGGHFIANRGFVGAKAVVESVIALRGFSTCTAFYHHAQGIQKDFSVQWNLPRQEKLTTRYDSGELCIHVDGRATLSDWFLLSMRQLQYRVDHLLRGRNMLTSNSKFRL